MTNNTTQTATNEAYYAAAERIAVERYAVPASLARQTFIELHNIPTATTFHGRVLTAANRAVDTMGSSIHPKALAENIVAAFAAA